MDNVPLHLPLLVAVPCHCQDSALAPERAHTRLEPLDNPFPPTWHESPGVVEKHLQTRAVNQGCRLAESWKSGALAVFSSSGHDLCFTFYLFIPLLNNLSGCDGIVGLGDEHLMSL